MAGIKATKWNKKRRRDTNESERWYYKNVILSDKVYKYLLPIRILLFPIALLIKLYKWTYKTEL